MKKRLTTFHLDKKNNILLFCPNPSYNIKLSKIKDFTYKEIEDANFAVSLFLYIFKNVPDSQIDEEKISFWQKSLDLVLDFINVSTEFTEKT